MSDIIQCGTPAATPLSTSLVAIHNRSEENLKTIHAPQEASTNTRTAEYNLIMAIRNAIAESMQPANCGCTLPPEFVAEITRSVLDPTLEFATKLYGNIKS